MIKLNIINQSDRDAEFNKIMRQLQDKLNAQSLYKVRLILEELVENIFTHAACVDELSVDVCIALDDKCIEITVIDNTEAFDIAAAIKKATADVSALRGRGLLLVRSLASQVNYKREDQLNHLNIKIEE